MLTELQKRTAQAIVNIFETGEITGDYARVNLLRGDSGHLTYGRSQTTLTSGNLYLLIKDYCDTPGAQFADELSSYLYALSMKDLALDHNEEFKSLLRLAGMDPVMRKVQDGFFDRVYWDPCQKMASLFGAETALSTGVIYDSLIHGSWRRMRDRTTDEHGSIKRIGELEWFARYVQVRKQWLGSHANPLLHRTVYRMDNFQNIIDRENWILKLPLNVHGVNIDVASLSRAPIIQVSAEEEGDRLLKLVDPALRGDDVRAVQRALNEQGLGVEMDGVYGKATEKAVISFQNDHGLKADGLVGPATRTVLGI